MIKPNPSFVPDVAAVEFIKKQLTKLAFLPGFPAEKQAFDMVAKTMARFASITPVDHCILGQNTNPTVWLVNEIAAKCERFPMPVRSRMMYNKYFSSEDGENVYDLEVV